VERPASRREPPVRGERGPQRGKAPRAGSWGCWAARAAPRAGRRPPRSAGPALSYLPPGPVHRPRRGTHPSSRHPRGPAGGSGRAARADAGASVRPGARPGTRRPRRRPRAPPGATATVASRRGPWPGPGRDGRPVPRRTAPGPDGPWARAAPSAAGPSGRRPSAIRPAGGPRAAGRGCACRGRRRRGRGRRSGRPGCFRRRTPTGRQPSARCLCGPSRCSCRLLPHVVSAAGEGAADKEKGRDWGPIRRPFPTFAVERVTEPLRNNSGPADDPISAPMTCRQEVHSERENGRRSDGHSRGPATRAACR
jgi:hypothetical protein